ncbi:MAG: dihydrolipoyl dehydrogenase [Candidatus Latescibacterota bacterium]
MALKVTIIGSGPGGYIAATEAARLGAEVTVIERGKIGGTCLNWGCIPTKTWKTAAERFRTARETGEYGIEITGEVRFNPPRLLERKNRVVDILARGIQALLKRHNVRYIEGEGTMLDPRRVRVRRPDGVTEEVTGDRLIIATGSSPLLCPPVPFDGEHVISTNEAVELAEIPKTLLIVGGGVNGCEFASIFEALGSKVTIVEATPGLLPLPSIDRDSVAVVEREMKKRGISVLSGRLVEGISYREGKARVTVVPARKEEASAKPAEPLVVEADKVLVTIGRCPVFRGLGLENIGIQRDAGGWIIAGDHLETNIPGVYAIGDILGPPKIMLAHVASSEGVIAARNALGGFSTMDYRVIPSGVFTTPEVASVGLTGEQAHEKGLEVRSSVFHFRALGKSQAMGEIAGQVKLVADMENRLLGVHIVGPHATDLIAEGALALKMGATVDDLAATIHAHPTLPEALWEAAMDLRTREPL